MLKLQVVTPWKVLSERTVLERPWATVRIQQVQTAAGVVLHDYPLVTTKDWACVVCLTEDNEFVLVRQYRHGVGRETLELPAGGVEPNEDPLLAAQRELAEETGYCAQDWLLLKTIHPETTRHSHVAHLFLARRARLLGKQQLDPGEDVEVDLLHVSKLPTLRADLSHGIHLLALLLSEAVLNGDSS